MFIRDITSRANPLIVNTSALLTAKGRKAQRRYLYEGIKLFYEAVDSDIPIEYIVATESCIGIIEKKLPNTSIKTYIVPATCFEKVSSEKAPQGIICVSSLNKLPDVKEASVDIPCVILSDIQDAGNVGTIIRTAKALCDMNVVLCGACADVFGHKTIRASMGAVFKQSIYTCESFEKAVEYFKSNGKQVYAAALSDSAMSIAECDLSNSVVALGNEGHGLSKDQIELCRPMIIPMHGMESLNVATAATVIIWEMARGGFNGRL